MEWIDTIIGLFTGGGLVAVATLPYTVKRARKAANEPELQAWQSLVNELQEQNSELRGQMEVYAKRIEELNKRIDTLYDRVGQWREKSNEQAATIKSLQSELQRLQKQ